MVVGRRTDCGIGYRVFRQAAHPAELEDRGSEAAARRFVVAPRVTARAGHMGHLWPPEGLQEDGEGNVANQIDGFAVAVVVPKSSKVLGRALVVSRRLRTAIIPAAGIHTRFLPATKAVPHAMMTILDRPMIDFAIEEGRRAGIEHFVIVTGQNGEVISQYLDRSFELEHLLESRGNVDALKRLRSRLPQDGQTSYARQQEALGLGHAIWCCQDIVGNQPFAVLLPDMIFGAAGDSGPLPRMVEAYEQHGSNIVAVHKVATAEAVRYGLASPTSEAAWPTELADFREKPSDPGGQWHYALSGRYILQPEIFPFLAEQKRGAGGEIQLTDSIQTLSKRMSVYGLVTDTEIHDCGTREGFAAFTRRYAQARNVSDKGLEEKQSELHYSAATTMILSRLIAKEIADLESQKPNDEEALEEFEREVGVLTDIQKALVNTSAAAEMGAEHATNVEETETRIRRILRELGKQLDENLPMVISVSIKSPIAAAALYALGLVGATMQVATPVVLAAVWGKPVFDTIKSALKDALKGD